MRAGSSSSRPSHLSTWPCTPDAVTLRWPLMPRPWPTSGDHQQPSALQQVPGEIALDADSLGLGGGEQARSVLDRRRCT